MTEFVATAAFGYVGALDLSGHIHKWQMNGTAELKKRTTFRNNNANVYKVGLKKTDLSANGYTDLAVGSADDLLHAAYAGRLSRVATFGNDEAEGQPCCMADILTTSFTPGGGGQVGEMSEFALAAVGTDVAGGVRGYLLKEQAAVSATGALGTAVQIGAVSATQYVYATLHLLGTAGTSITVLVESDDNSGFTTATTRGTFGPLTASGGNWLTPVAGAISDDWWRLRVSAITGTWTVAGAVGIQ